MNNIDTMTVVELKALAYDTISFIEKQQQSLRVINEKIASMYNIPDEIGVSEPNEQPKLEETI